MSAKIWKERRRWVKIRKLQHVATNAKASGRYIVLIASYTFALWRQRRGKVVRAGYPLVGAPRL